MSNEHSHDDIDAQFADLVAGIDGLSMDTDINEHAMPVSDVDASGANADAQDADPRDAQDIPVDESLHLDGGRLSVALVLAPITRPEALHSLCALAGIRCNVVRLKPWSAVWMRVETPPTDEDELDEILTGVKPMPPEVDAVARMISRLSKYGAVAVMSWLVEGDGVEPGVSGRITAQRYVGGEPEEAIPAGLLLGSMPQAAEDLLLGRMEPSDYADSVLADGSSRRRPGPFGWMRKKQ
ncbi:hypothetical protein G7Y41_03415 [Schaalia sp. ZJ405]|nr:hypothetical protein [Schaalia sp. ZJ405]QPK81884.1 hypothetical protein G7Y41_03415 [Schaalia sp. ZJ405]